MNIRRKVLFLFSVLFCLSVSAQKDTGLFIKKINEANKIRVATAMGGNALAKTASLDLDPGFIYIGSPYDDFVIVNSGDVPPKIKNGQYTDDFCAGIIITLENHYGWDISTDNGNTWTGIGATGSTYQAPALTQTTYYRRVSWSYDAFGCTIRWAVSDPVRIIVQNSGTLSGGTIAAASQTICTNTSVTLTNTASPAGGTWPLHYSWEQKTGTGSYTAIPNATGISYTSTASTTETTYRRKTTDATNISSYSNEYTVFIQPPNAIAIITNGTIVSGSCTAILNAQTSTGGTYQWQLKNSSNTYQNINGATASSYTVTQSGDYRVVVGNNVCSNITSSSSLPTTVTISSTPPGNSPDFGNNNWRVYAYNGTNQNLSANSYRGYYDYAISFITNIYEPSEFTRSQSPSYLPATPNNSSPWYGCPVDVDNFTMVFKRRGFNCGNYIIRIRVGRNEAYTIYLNGNLFASGSNPSSSSDYVVLTPTSIPLDANSTLELRTQHFTGELRSDFEVEQQNVGLTNGYVQPASGQTIQYNTAPNTFTSSTNGTATNNALTYQWERASTNAGPWTAITNATASTYQSPVLLQTTYFRRGALNGTCEGPKYTNNIAINVINVPATQYMQGGTIAASSVSICNNSSMTINNLTDPSGGTGAYTYSWEQRTGTGSLIAIPNATGTSYTTPLLTASTTYRRKATDGNNDIAYSNEVIVSIFPLNAVANITNGATASSNCNIVLNAQTATGNTYQWQQKIGSNYQDINGAINSTYTTTQSGDYKVVVTNTTCSTTTATSNPITVQVITEPVAAITNGSTVAANCSVVLNASTASGNTYQWQKRDINNNYSSLSGANSSSYTATASGDYRVVVSNSFCGNIISSNSLPIIATIASTPPGNGIDFGNGNWRVYAYNGVDQNLDANVYRGYYDYALSFLNSIYEPAEFTRSESPSYLPAVPNNSSPWNGCPVNVDYFTMVAKRRGFQCGSYQVRIRVGQNELYAVYLNGILIGSGGNSTSSSIYVVLSNTALDANSTLEARVRHYTGELRFDFEVDQQNVGLTNGYIQPGGGQTINYNAAPMTFTSSTDGTSTNGTLNYQWEKAPTNTGPWTVIPNATGLTYSSPALQQTTYFRRGASNGTCEGPKYTNNVLITVNDMPLVLALDAGSITPSASSICNSNNDLRVNSSVDAFGGTNPLSYSWEQKNVGGSFTTIPNVLTAYAALGDISATTTFRRKVTDADGNFSYSNEVTIYKLLAGSITPTTQTIIAGNTPTAILSADLASGSITPITYQWQSSASATGTWSNIASEVNPTLQLGPINQTIYYRRVAITTTCAGGVASNVSEVIAQPIPVFDAGTISSPSTPCAALGSTLNMLTATAATNGVTPYTYLWQKNENGIWVDIAGSNTQNYQPDPIISNTSFRRQVTDHNGLTAVSNQVTINLQSSSLKAGIIDGRQVICSGTVADRILSVIDACGTGNLTYAWELNISNGNTWLPINNASEITYNTTLIFEKTRFRRKVSDGCGYAGYSNVVEVLVYPAIEAGTVYPDVQTVCTNEPKHPLALTQECHYTNGSVSYQWQTSTSLSGPWNDIPAATNATYLPTSIDPSTYYRLKVSSTTCDAVNYSNTALVMVNGCTSKTAPATSLTAVTSGKPGMKAYPNPAEQGKYVNVAINGTEGSYKAILKGTDGRTYNCSVTSSAKGQLQIKLPSPMAKGIYLIQVSNTKQQWTEKIMVQ